MGLAAAGIGAGTSLLGGIFGANAANKAGQIQANAANNAANFAKNQQSQALGTIDTNLGKELDLLSPYLTGGSQAMANLSSLTGTQGQGLLAPWTGTFKAPTAEESAATPGYQFQVDQATKQLQNSAAGRGGLLNGGTAKALDQYTQGLASENYGNVYNRAFNEYLQNYNQFQQNQANTYGRLRDLSGIGQWASGTGVGALNNATGQTVGTLMDTSRQVGQDLTGAGAAQAAGQVGAANAWNGALSGVGNAATSYGLLSQLNGMYQPQSPTFTPNLSGLSGAQISGIYGGPSQAPLIPYNGTGY